MATPIAAVSPSVRVKFILAAKEGNVEALKKFAEDKVSLDTVDSCGVSFILTVFRSALGIRTRPSRSDQLSHFQRRQSEHQSKGRNDTAAPCRTETQIEFGPFARGGWRRSQRSERGASKAD
jgi:hypothetical protein